MSSTTTTNLHHKNNIQSSELNFFFWIGCLVGRSFGWFGFVANVVVVVVWFVLLVIWVIFFSQKNRWLPLSFVFFFKSGYYLVAISTPFSSNQAKRILEHVLWLMIERIQSKCVYIVVLLESHSDAFGYWIFFSFQIQFYFEKKSLSRNK